MRVQPDCCAQPAIWLNPSQPHQFSCLNFLSFGRCWRGCNPISMEYVLVVDFLGGDLLGYDTFWESDYLAPRPYETDVLTPDVQARDVVSDYPRNTTRRPVTLVVALFHLLSPTTPRAAPRPASVSFRLAFWTPPE